MGEIMETVDSIFKNHPEVKAVKITKAPTQTETSAAFNVVRDAMVADSEYAWSWHCNIAMASVDEGMDHAAANRAAARFMQICFGVDTSKSPQYATLHIEH